MINSALIQLSRLVLFPSSFLVCALVAPTGRDSTYTYKCRAIAARLLLVAPFRGAAVAPLCSARCSTLDAASSQPLPSRLFRGSAQTTMPSSSTQVRRLISVALVLEAALLAFARPRPLTPRQSITTLSSTQVDDFTPYTFFASAAYCEPDTTINWSCGCK